MSDFFTAVGTAGATTDSSLHSNHQDDTVTFADAIAARFGQLDSNVLTARLLPQAQTLRLPHTPMHNLAIQPPATSSSSEFTAVTPSGLAEWLDDPQTLVVDIRPHAAYSSARIHRAISLSVPSTLLKRPAFSLSRLSAMLPSHSARIRFSAWPSASRILVYDADSNSLSESSNIQGLLRKFRAAAPDAPTDLAWVQGGFQTVWQAQRDLVDAYPASPDHENDDDDDGDQPADVRHVLRAHQLPRAAFALSSTTQAPRNAGFQLLNPSFFPNANYALNSTHATTTSSAHTVLHPSLAYPANDNPEINHPGGVPSFSRTTTSNTASAYNPFFDAVRQNTELLEGITERIPLKLPRWVRRRVEELPFKWLRDIAKKAGAVTPQHAQRLAGAMDTLGGLGPYRGGRLIDSSEDDTTEFDESSDSSTSGSGRAPPGLFGPSSPSRAPHANTADMEEGTEALAMQFYRIELAEQRRMMGVMEHHSRESGFVGAGSSAAEKGKVDFPPTTSSSSLSSGSGSASGGEDDVKMLGAASDSSNSLSTNSSGSTNLSTDTADSSVSSGSGSGSEVAGAGKGKSSEGTGSTAGKHGPHEGKREKGAFPFSITAGVEKGSKNRYRNIWPFEHARVRLHRLNSGKIVPVAHTSTSAPPGFSPTTTDDEVKQRRALTDPGKQTPRPQHKTRTRIPADGDLALPPSHVDFVKPVREDKETVDKTDYRKLEAPAEDADADDETEPEPEEYDNYINASYVQPLGTRRRYIATQGPLEATFGDFWTLVWQQNVHVVVMLTREVEGALIKCGAYWKSGTYGPLRVELLGCAAEGCRGECPHCSTQAGAEPESGGFFSSVQSQHPLPPPQSTIPTTPLSPRSGPLLPAQPKVPSGQLIKRTLRLTHAGYPSARPRKIVQLHYLGWPDMNVPNDATGVLGLVWEVGRVVEEVGREEVAPRKKNEEKDGSSGSDSEVDGETGVLKRSLHAGDAQAPVLLHCSAGVGRTGGFIAVDAVLNAVRQEAREMYGSGRTTRPASFGSAAAEPFARGGSSQAGWSESSEAPSVRVSPFPKQTQDEGDAMDVDIAVEDADAVMTHEGRGLRTPMQVDETDSQMQLGSTTQRWVEDVADTKVVSAFTAASRPATSTPVSVGPSSISSAASLSSSGLGAPFQLQPPIPSMHRSTFSLNLPSAPSNLSIASISSPRPMSPEQQQKASSMPLSIRRGYVDHRMRTFSAPGAPALPIPAANSVPWLLPSNGTPSTSSQSGKVLLDRSLANSPLPRSVSPISSMEPSLAEGRRATDLGPVPQQYVDYKEPRALHGRNSVRPVRLSGFDDPIWEVVQDMREQRMSLCQSLRQYVFVHAAIIEGSLLVVDEERARAGISWRPSKFATTPRRNGHRKTPRPPPPPSLLLSSGTSSTTNSAGKRQASPTELPKEDKKGEIALAKRLSIKRKQPSSDELTHADRSPLATFPPP